ncbi:MAG: carboxypeptidase M32 [Candidatus Bathyarchaeota archaeon]|nr:MAG: carboxypeptidase M32 [Candidatus Bathyarchaeota archaeon]
MTVSLISRYKKLLEKAKDTVILQTTTSIIHWDMETMMPPKAIDHRSQQLALLSQIEHKLSTNPEIGKLLNEIMKHPEYDRLDNIQQRNVYLIKKEYDEQIRLPEDLVSRTAKQKATTIDVWKKAKANKNFSILKPELERLLSLKKKAAEILMKVKETSTSYDAMIDIYEPKMSSETISKIFGDLKEGLISLAGECETAKKQPDVSILKRQVPIRIQRGISNSIAEFVGYDVKSKEAGGRIDETEHPFTIGYYDDVRITTHYYEENFTSALFSTLHECGHALYDQNLNPELMFQPVGTGCSMGFHESQSRFVENIIGRSREFWLYFLPRLKMLTGRILSNVDLDAFVFAINQVKPSKIRVEADEVTYGLHIIIRFNLEQDLFGDKITVRELPEVWNQNYKDYLGVDIKNDAEGVMQDTHWASGLYGYFPSYTLGNIYSAQISAALEKDKLDWRNQIAQGNFLEIRRWLTKNIHTHGKIFEPSVLLKTVTGEELTVNPYLNYLNQKYSLLYNF